jgi:hypothetical protein
MGGIVIKWELTEGFNYPGQKIFFNAGQYEGSYHKR